MPGAGPAFYFKFSCQKCSGNIQETLEHHWGHTAHSTLRRISKSVFDMTLGSKFSDC